MELGAEVDEDTKALIFKGKKEEKITPAQGPAPNESMTVVRPNLKECTFEELQKDWFKPITEEERKTVTKPDIKFIKGDSEAHDQTIMVSFPRSGNTMLRAYLEKILGVATGSDGDVKAKLIGELM